MPRPRKDAEDAPEKGATVRVVAVHPFWLDGKKIPRESLLDIPEDMAANLHRNGVVMRAG